jgi:hypothetical protein
MRTKVLVGVAALLAVAAVLALVPTQAMACEGQSGTTLTAWVDCVLHSEKTFQWTIDKAVTPDTLAMFQGDSGSVQYTITVTKDNGTDHAWVDGYVHVNNGGAVATEGLAISIDVTMPPSQTPIASGTVNVSGNPVLDPGETGSYAYSIDIGSPVAGHTYKVTAHVTITNHSGHLDVPFGPSPSCTDEMPSPTPVNSSINVDDTNGGSWLFNASGSVSYSKSFTCNADQGSHNNTATIRETAQSDGASVTVNCYALSVTKDVATSLTRKYYWKIEKSADHGDGDPAGNNVEKVVLALGQQHDINYTVTVGLDTTGHPPNGYEDSAWAISGNIAVHNPAPIAATINSVSDAVSNIGAATVNCPVTFPYSLAAGGTLNCTYSLAAPNADTQANTATATLQNTPSGTTDFSGSAAVDFAKATIDKIDECITVSDDKGNAGNPVELGTVCVGEALPKEFTYTLTVGPYDEGNCGNPVIDNTASFVTNDTQTTGSATWRLIVTVTGCPLTTGCTLTPGYWKTHSSYGPAPYDDNWALLLPSGPDSPFFKSSQTYYQVLWTNPAGGNAYYILAHAYIAAQLNSLNGASVPTAVQDAFDDATALFEAWTPAQILALKGKNATSLRAQFIGYAAILDQYNNGLAEGGPPHCSE